MFSIFFRATELSRPLPLDTVWLCWSAVRFRNFLCEQEYD